MNEKSQKNLWYGVVAAVVIFSCGGAYFWFASKRDGIVVSETEQVTAPTVYEFATEKRGAELSAVVTLLDGELSFDVAELPHLGSGVGEVKLVALMDYSSAESRRHHQVMSAVVEAFDGQVTVLKLPATSAGTDSAEIHETVLAAWKADPEMYRILDRHLIEGRVRATPEGVVAEAVRLIGANRLAEVNVQHHEWIRDQLAKTQTLLDANSLSIGRRTVPQTIVGTELVVGFFPEASRFIESIEKQYGLQASKIPEVQRDAIGLNRGMIDLGEVMPGDKVDFSVEVTNRDSEELRLGWMGMGEDLLVEKFQREPIARDGTTEIRLSLTVPEVGVGRIERVVTINPVSGHSPRSVRVVASIGGGVAQVSDFPSE